ncbi:MAG TPA: PEGA domain-containing protein, partial [Candidatus Acidoferrales bacterium]|nr:PEGA domain-containing protein [Candidatus Acidoferrales bacterium]
MRKMMPLALLFVFSMAALLSAAPALAQNGKLKIKVTPKQAYVFVDGNAIKDGNQTIKLAPGKHTVAVYNYGYTPQTQDVEITAKKTTQVSVTLQAAGGTVSGPFGKVQFKGPGHAAVLLNGTSPAYFVGPVKQKLIVPPAAYQANVTQNGKTNWSGPVTAKAGQLATVDLKHNGATKYKNWAAG